MHEADISNEQVKDCFFLNQDSNISPSEL